MIKARRNFPAVVENLSASDRHLTETTSRYREDDYFPGKRLLIYEACYRHNLFLWRNMTTTIVDPIVGVFFTVELLVPPLCMCVLGPTNLLIWRQRWPDPSIARASRCGERNSPTQCFPVWVRRQHRNTRRKSGASTFRTTRLNLGFAFTVPRQRKIDGPNGTYTSGGD